MKAIYFDNGYGIPMLAVKLDKLDRYGRTWNLVAEEPMIEFYDLRYHCETLGPTELNLQAQFITRYQTETLLEHSPAYGLNLMGHVRDWKISATQLQYVLKTLEAL